MLLVVGDKVLHVFIIDGDGGILVIGELVFFLVVGNNLAHLLAHEHLTAILDGELIIGAVDRHGDIEICLGVTGRDLLYIEVRTHHVLLITVTVELYLTVEEGGLEQLTTQKEILTRHLTCFCRTFGNLQLGYDGVRTIHLLRKLDVLDIDLVTDGFGINGYHQSSLTYGGTCHHLHKFFLLISRATIGIATEVDF